MVRTVWFFFALILGVMGLFWAFSEPGSSPDVSHLHWVAMLLGAAFVILSYLFVVERVSCPPLPLWNGAVWKVLGYYRTKRYNYALLQYDPESEPRLYRLPSFIIFPTRAPYVEIRKVSSGGGLGYKRWQFLPCTDAPQKWDGLEHVLDD